MIVHVAVIENDTGDDLSIYAGSSWLQVAQEVAREFWCEGDEDRWYSEPSEFLAENPLNEAILASAEELEEWLAGFREAATVPWATFVEREVETD